MIPQSAIGSSDAGIENGSSSRLFSSNSSNNDCNGWYRCVLACGQVLRITIGLCMIGILKLIKIIRSKPIIFIGLLFVLVLINLIGLFYFLSWTKINAPQVANYLSTDTVYPNICRRVNYSITDPKNSGQPSLSTCPLFLLSSNGPSWLNMIDDKIDEDGSERKAKEGQEKQDSSQIISSSATSLSEIQKSKPLYFSWADFSVNSKGESWSSAILEAVKEDQDIKSAVCKDSILAAPGFCLAHSYSDWPYIQSALKLSNQDALPMPWVSGGYLGSQAFIWPDDGQLFNKCAVVGSSGKLLLQENGRRIDNEFDAIWRMNMSPVDGYEKWVGTKTTHLTIGTKTLLDIFPIVEHAPGGGGDLLLEMVGLDPLNLERVDIFCFGRLAAVTHKSCSKLKFMLKEYSPVRVILPSDNFFTWAYCSYYDAFSRSSYATGGSVSYPSSGISAIYLASMMCKEIELFGFGKSDDPTVCYRYYKYPDEEYGPDENGRCSAEAFQGRTRHHDFSFEEEYRISNILSHPCIESAPE